MGIKWMDLFEKEIDPSHTRSKTSERQMFNPIPSARKAIEVSLHSGAAGSTGAESILPIVSGSYNSPRFISVRPGRIDRYGFMYLFLRWALIHIEKVKNWLFLRFEKSPIKSES